MYVCTGILNSEFRTTWDFPRTYYPSVYFKHFEKVIINICYMLQHHAGVYFCVLFTKENDRM